MILILLNQHEVLFSAYVLPVPLCFVDSASTYPDPHIPFKEWEKKTFFFLHEYVNSCQHVTYVDIFIISIKHYIYGYGIPISVCFSPFSLKQTANLSTERIYRANIELIRRRHINTFRKWCKKRCFCLERSQVGVLDVVHLF